MVWCLKYVSYSYTITVKNEHHYINTGLFMLHQLGLTTSLYQHVDVSIWQQKSSKNGWEYCDKHFNHACLTVTCERKEVLYLRHSSSAHPTHPDNARSHRTMCYSLYTDHWRISFHGNYMLKGYRHFVCYALVLKNHCRRKNTTVGIHPYDFISVQT